MNLSLVINCSRELLIKQYPRDARKLKQRNRLQRSSLAALGEGIRCSTASFERSILTKADISHSNYQ